MTIIFADATQSSGNEAITYYKHPDHEEITASCSRRPWDKRIWAVSALLLRAAIRQREPRSWGGGSASAVQGAASAGASSSSYPCYEFEQECVHMYENGSERPPKSSVGTHTWMTQKSVFLLLPVQQTKKSKFFLWSCDIVWYSSNNIF